MTKGWCLRYLDKRMYNNINNYISKEPIYTDINKFLDHLKFKINLEIKIYGNNFYKMFNMFKKIDDYDIKHINNIKEFEYVYYDDNMDIVCWIEVHYIIN